MMGKLGCVFLLSDKIALCKYEHYIVCEWKTTRDLLVFVRDSVQYVTHVLDGVHGTKRREPGHDAQWAVPP